MNLIQSTRFGFWERCAAPQSLWVQGDQLDKFAGRMIALDRFLITTDTICVMDQTRIGSVAIFQLPGDVY